MTPTTVASLSTPACMRFMASPSRLKCSCLAACTVTVLCLQVQNLLQHCPRTRLGSGTLWPGWAVTRVCPAVPGAHTQGDSMALQSVLYLPAPGDGSPPRCRDTCRSDFSVSDSTSLYTCKAQVPALCVNAGANAGCGSRQSWFRNQISPSRGCASEPIGCPAACLQQATNCCKSQLPDRSLASSARLDGSWVLTYTSHKSAAS